MSDYETIGYQRHGDIGTLTLARANKRNAQNPLMWKELALLGIELLSDDTLRCLVVTGEGSTFSAGINLVEGMAGIVASRAITSELSTGSWSKNGSPSTPVQREIGPESPRRVAFPVGVLR
jgi:enoyl-CoA hydratase/carnithine racemase